MHVPMWLLGVIERCLEKLPENRFASGMALQEAIVKSGIADTGNRIADNSGISLLQMENDRLNALLLVHADEQAAEGKADPGVVVISKPVFFVLLVAVALMIALLSYFLLFHDPAPVRKVYKEKVVVPDSTAEDTQHKGYAWDKEQQNTAGDTTDTESRPVEIKPAPEQQPDTTRMDLDTTVHF